ncbi:LysR family transcriptional regulator [Methylobacterium sp. A49B]|uniref:LysR family transcriptional regulator n=1 Tax=Methylobacterium mesophilicum SR1.6/6 TaxID=908290 RepID=A0A6B9FGV1_9HYPH|nr:LysR family transcriptional regulator [Methylobacterium mesophilicum]QGY01667.1 LysR family transcriptional regulator [Methylobacterium mesophilicum SR1.6/6]
MELRHLRYFAAVAEHLSFTAAAASLGVSQPPLSQQIRDLEIEIGVNLFERSSRRVALTAAGEDFLRNARAILAQAADSVDRARTIGTGTTGILNIGMTSSVLVGPLGFLIRSFEQRFEGVDVRIHEMAPADQIAALKAHRTDLSFLRSPPEDPDLVAHRAWEERLCVALPAGHELATGRSVPIDIFRTERLVSLRLESSRFADEIYQACVLRGFTPDIAQQVREASSLVSLVAAGFGLAIIPEFVGRVGHPDVTVLPIDPPFLSADVYALHHARKNPVLNNFLDMIRREAPRLAERFRAA